MDGSLVVSVQAFDQRLTRLREAFSSAGLFVFLPVGLDTLDLALADSGSPRLGAFSPGVSAAVLIGDGGSTFFESFEDHRRGGQSSDSSTEHPLDDFTERRFAEILRDAWGPAGTWRALFPFVHRQPTLSFQKLGLATGLPAPGPLGLQIHPTFGPWWCFRGLALLSSDDSTVRSSPSETPIFDSCHTCAKPCLAACPVGATTKAGFQVGICAEHRLSNARAGNPLCATSCGARSSCPVGVEHRYAERQIAFHMKASLVTIETFSRS